MQTYKDHTIVTETGEYWVRKKGCKRGNVVFFMMPEHLPFIEKDAMYCGPLQEPIDESKLWHGAEG